METGSGAPSSDPAAVEGREEGRVCRITPESPPEGAAQDGDKVIRAGPDAGPTRVAPRNQSAPGFPGADLFIL